VDSFWAFLVLGLGTSGVSAAALYNWITRRYEV